MQSYRISSILSHSSETQIQLCKPSPFSETPYINHYIIIARMILLFTICLLGINNYQKVSDMVSLKIFSKRFPWIIANVEISKSIKK